MIHTPFDPSDLSGDDREWWDTWEARADTARERTVASHNEDGAAKFNPTVWAELREWLFQHVFHHKCAYCEGKVTGQAWGAAEHWRPKGGVSRQVEGKREQINRDGALHPGYYWLAYDWENLVPACERCNAGNGKGTQFPVEAEHAFCPEEGASSSDLDERERPLLLHPFHGGARDPSQHIYFDEFGMPQPYPNSKYGAVTIDVFNLDRDDLNDERRTLFDDLQLTVQEALAKTAQGYGPIGSHLDRYSAAHRAYSLAARDFIRAHVRDVLQGLINESADWLHAHGPNN